MKAGHTTMSIVLPEDLKEFLKIYAIQRKTTVSAIFAAYAEQLRREAAQAGGGTVDVGNQGGFVRKSAAGGMR